MMIKEPVFQRTLMADSGSPAGRELGSLRASPTQETVSNKSFLQGFKANLAERKRS